MSILSPKYDVELHFSDLVEVVGGSWNAAYFSILSLSDIQAKSGLIDGTFEKVWPEILAAHYSNEVLTMKDTICTIMFNAISPFLKKSAPGRPTHIYIPDVKEYGARNQIFLNFTIWDEIQRELIFDIKFRFKD